MSQESLAQMIDRPISERSYHLTNIASLLIVLRHGQAAYTKEEDEGGDAVEGNLTEEGQTRVRAATEEIINQLISTHTQKLNLISSPKRRCLQTRDILLNTFEHIGVSIETQIDPALRDVKVIGPTTNLPNSYQRWEKDMLPGENWFAAWMRKAKEGITFYPGEESPDDVQTRVALALPPYLSSPTPTILVCHEETLGAIAYHLNITWTRPTYGEVWYFFHQ
ncbi:MAG: hypothetical protein ACD_40C00108G0005 [uncultured bacterium]|nr:MAG: hypothetical protein ACD_40C00108G0005 [uncultured bacterium]